MIELPVYNGEGKEVDRMQIDESVLGTRVRPKLLKQAVVMYHANQRQGTVGTKSRGMVMGSTRKIYRQKGTGNARMGANRTVVRKGGGVAFAKRTRDFSQRMPKKQKQVARNSAILAKIKSEDTLVIDQLSIEQPRTREMAATLTNLNIDRSCLVTTGSYDVNIYKSFRNIPKVEVLTSGQLNAGAIINHRKLLFTKEALENLMQSASGASAGNKE
jgi:large subunit ribosomal protein L4